MELINDETDLHRSAGADTFPRAQRRLHHFIYTRQCIESFLLPFLHTLGSLRFLFLTIINFYQHKETNFWNRNYEKQKRDNNSVLNLGMIFLSIFRRLSKGGRHPTCPFFLQWTMSNVWMQLFDRSLINYSMKLRLRFFRFFSVKWSIALNHTCSFPILFWWRGK